MTERISEAGLDLMAQVVDANVRNLATVTDRLLDNKDEDIKRLALALMQIETILDDATVIDRKTEARLRAMEPAFWTASDILSRMEEPT